MGGKMPPEGTSLTGARPDGKKAQVGLSYFAKTQVAMWSTPRASDGEKGGPNMSFGAGGQPLPAQAYHTAMGATPTARDHQRGVKPPRPWDTGVPLSQQIGQALGLEPNTEKARTEKPGALNPEFVFWLMGYPAEWLSCAPEATR